MKLLIDEEAAKLVNDEEIEASRRAERRAERHRVSRRNRQDHQPRGDFGGADVSRQGVQRDLLPLVEGTTVSTKYGMIKTDHILFIASGAFHLAKPSDLIPELQGRFPIRVELASLSADDFVQILTNTDACLTRQYEALLETEGVKLEFTISGIAPQAQESAASAGAGLAFALRLSREAPATPEGDASTETAGAGTSLHAFANELEAAAGKAVTEIKTRAGDENAANASPAAANILENSVAAPTGNEPTQSAPAASSAAKVDAPELPSPPSTPVRAVRVELGSESNQRVALTLVERGGLCR